MGRRRASVRASLAVLAVAFQAAEAVGQVTLQVPSTYPTIQAAIGAAADGDTVLVAPGVYTERLDFIGKAITVRSANGPGTTIIDGQAGGSVVTFVSGEGLGSAIDGFTIRNGKSIVGAGIDVRSSSPTISNNRIINNTSFAGQSGFGGGILLADSSAHIVGNVIAYNTVFQGDAGGIGTTWFTNSPVIERNVIHHNWASGNGGAFHLRNSTATLRHNTIVNNTAGNGSGVYCYADGAGPKHTDISSCILWGNSGSGPLANEGPLATTSVAFSDVQGGWPGMGNINANPLFASPSSDDYNLLTDSPCIDSGDPSSPLDPDGTPADMGALPTGGQPNVVTLRSGNGPIGSTDSLITFLAGPGSTPFGAPFSPAEFEAASAGPSAKVVTPHPAWLPSLPSDPTARWVSTADPGAPGQGEGGDTALYAIPFVAPAHVSSASLDLVLLVDDYLGFGPNEGVFVNGVPVANTQTSGFLAETSYQDLDISSAVAAGPNVLYLNVGDIFAASGLIFSGTITFTVGVGTWEDLRNGLAGTPGVPVLTGTGDLYAGTPVTLALSNSKSLALAFLVVGFSDASLQFKGGIMVPHPDLNFVTFTDGLGGESFSALWPAGVPTGFQTFMQFWIVDAAGPQGFAASTGLVGTAP